LTLNIRAVLEAIARVPRRLSQLTTGAVADALASFLARGGGEEDGGAWPDELDGTPEHPWAFHHIQALGRELTIVEVGGEDAGLRSTLARAGHRVIAVGRQRASGASGAVVQLRADDLPRADIPEASVDVLVSIKALEHLTDTEADAVLAKSRRVLRPGGHVVVSLSAGRSDVRPVLDALDAELVTGELLQPRGFVDPAIGPRAEHAASVARCFVGRKR
jgi:SAM-dependent methyltransferase